MENKTAIIFAGISIVVIGAFLLGRHHKKNAAKCCGKPGCKKCGNPAPQAASNLLSCAANAPAPACNGSNNNLLASWHALGHTCCMVPVGFTPSGSAILGCVNGHLIIQ